MWLSAIGMVPAVMTAVTRFQAMNAITAKIVSGTIAVSVQRTVRFATRQSAWGAAMNARSVNNQYVSDVLPPALNARRPFVKIVSLKKEYVITV